VRHLNETDTPLSADGEITRQAQQVRNLLIESSTAALLESQEVLLRMKGCLAAKAMCEESVDEGEARLLIQTLRGVTALAFQGQHLVAARLQALLGPCLSARDEAGMQSTSSLSRFWTEL
jgi:hypothetical protein